MSAFVYDEETLRTPSELPENHLFRLIYRWYDPTGGPDGLDRFHNMRRPVDWEAVSNRLETQEGREELHHWVWTAFGKRLFLHQFCYFDFGEEGNVEEGRMAPCFAVNRSVGLRIMECVVEAYPDALRMPDGGGYYPFHIICMRRNILDDHSTIKYEWRYTTLEVFNVLCRKCPDVLSQRNQVNGRHALHCLLSSHTHSEEEEGKAQECVFQTLIDASPKAIQMPDLNNSYPIHEACFSGKPTCVLKPLIAAYPQALHQQEKVHGRTPILFLVCYHGSAQAIRLVLEACPWAAGISDHEMLTTDEQGALYSVGDALDYISLRFCEWEGVNFFLTGEVIMDDFEDGVFLVPYRKGYIAGNIAHVERSEDERNERRRDEHTVFETLLDILRVMYGRPCFLPLHAAVQGRLCRPWNVVVLHALLSRYNAGANDSEGNLPLHLLLESSLIEQERAIQVRLAGDSADYENAVGKCFKLLVDAYPPAVRMVNGDGRFPLHLAIQYLHETPFDLIIGPLLKQFPEALHALDPKTQFYPFLNAGIGGSANLTLVYQLLRKDPSCLQKQVGAGNQE